MNTTLVAPPPIPVERSVHLKRLEAESIHILREVAADFDNPAIHYRVDVNTLQRSGTRSLSLNEIGCCQLRLHDAIVFDGYDKNRTTGSFILVDRITHETVAAGMLIDNNAESAAAGHWNTASSVVQPQAAKSLISSEQRAARYGQTPRTILITGLSGSGKTSITQELERRLFESGRTAMVLDGQTLRLGISRDLGFTAEERSENLRRTYVAPRSLRN